MTARLIHKAGDTFLEACYAYTDLDATVARDLTGVTVTAKMTAPLQADVDFDVAIIDAPNGQFSIGAAASVTALWRPTTWHAWITYTEGGTVASTEVFQIEVVENHNAAV